MTRKKTNSLAGFIRSNLGISLKEFAELENMNVRTIEHRWASDKNRKSVVDAVFRRYVENFKGV